MHSLCLSRNMTTVQFYIISLLGKTAELILPYPFTKINSCPLNVSIYGAPRLSRLAWPLAQQDSRGTSTFFGETRRSVSFFASLLHRSGCEGGKTAPSASPLETLLNIPLTNRPFLVLSRLSPLPIISNGRIEKPDVCIKKQKGSKGTGNGNQTLQGI